jgi:CubicO group peptidase (beta-lactamase class C family)
MKATLLRTVMLSFLAGWVLVFAQAQSASSITVAQVQAAIGETKKLVQSEVEAGVVPGIAIGVVFQNKLLYAQGFGVRDTRTGEAIDADTVFQLASVSKPISSTVLASLVGEGLVSWDSKLTDLDPAFAMYDPWATREVTIRDMYTHRSGLPEHAGDLLEDLGFTRQQVLRRLRYQPPVSSFRSTYAYTNYGLTAAAVAGASVTGQTWAELSENRLYEPLGMDATSSRFADFMAQPNKALGHVLKDGKWVHEQQRQPDAQTPAGGVSSSVNDMAKWMRLQLAGGTFEGNRIVSERALAETHEPLIFRNFSPFDGLPGFYGLGWNVGYDAQGRLRLGHSGAFVMGASTSVNLVPAEQLGIVILSNGSPTGVSEAISTIFLERALYGEPTKDWLYIFKTIFVQLAQEEDLTAQYTTKPTPITPALPDEAYLGTYSNELYGNVEVIESNSGLANVQGPNDMMFAMTHFDHDTFTYVTQGESAVGTAGVFFHIGSDGKATGVTVENLDTKGQGTFTKVAQ